MKTKYSLSLIFTLTSYLFNAQGYDTLPTVMDTILANDQKNVALFFPDPIRQGITGSENFVFTYNRENQQHLGLLQATPGDESNLLVISSTGAVFSYIIKYAKHLTKLNYFIDESGSIGFENPESDPTKVERDGIQKDLPEIIPTERDLYYKNFSSYLLRSQQRLGRISKKVDGIRLQVENIVFHGEELYFVIKLDNSSNVDYKPSFLNISVETRQKGKRKSMQKLLQYPVFFYNLPAIVKKGNTSRFVYVLPKFTIAEDKVVIIDLKEENGERDIVLKVNKKYLNNPN